jgi:transglutaminase-like putative cysteine protease
MKMRIGVSVSLIALVSAAMAGAADVPDKQPKRGPIPAWVKLVDIPAPDPKKADAPYQVLLLEGQTRFESTGANVYFEMAIKPQTVAGLQGFSTIVLPWNMDRADLTVHSIEAIRDGKSIDLTKGTPFTILRRESKLEQSQINGVRSVVLPAKGVELGDTIRISASYHELPSEFAAKPEELAKWVPPFPVVMMDRRVVVAPNVDIKWRVRGRAPTPTITKTAEGTEYRFITRSIEPAKYAKNMRGRDQADEIQFSAYRDWADAVRSHIPLYAKARQSAPNSPLMAEAEKIAASSSDPLKRMMAALRLSQERVRYIAMLLGDGAYRPAGADETWEARYGDCKAKSALLLALLDRLGIQAQPMYVNANAGDALADRLPSLDTFDHVIVKATVNGKAYYLDATDYGYRVPSEVEGSPLEFELPIAEGATLEKLPPYTASIPTIETDLVWDGSQSLTGDVPYKARLTLRGPMAVQARVKKSSTEDASEFETFLKEYIRHVPNDKLTIASQKDDGETGDYVVEFSGKADMGWDEYEDRKGVRFPFSNDASNWNVDFDRAEGPYKESRVVLNPAYWQRETETVVVPSTKGFKIDDSVPLDRTLAGTRIWRSVTQDGDRITSTTNFRHLAKDISAEEALGAEAAIKEVSENWAYLVGPRSLRTASRK